jgi:hypothetical protein
MGVCRAAHVPRCAAANEVGREEGPGLEVSPGAAVPSTTSLQGFGCGYVRWRVECRTGARRNSDRRSSAYSSARCGGARGGGGALGMYGAETASRNPERRAAPLPSSSCVFLRRHVSLQINSRLQLVLSVRAGDPTDERVCLESCLSLLFLPWLPCSCTPAERAAVDPQAHGSRRSSGGQRGQRSCLCARCRFRADACHRRHQGFARCLRLSRHVHGRMRDCCWGKGRPGRATRRHALKTRGAGSAWRG